MEEIALSKKRIGYCREIARKVFEKVESEIGKINPPVPIYKIADFHGFEVYPLQSIPKEQSAIVIIDTKSGRRLIGINSMHHEHRQRFSVGHELGHYFLNHPSEDQCDDDEIKLYNREADEFSAELLIPLKLLKEHLAYTKDIKRLAAIFKVSEQSMWIKLNQQRLIKKLF